MTKEEKILLLQDLCGRLPYEVKGLHREQVHIVTNIEPNVINPIIKVDGYDAWFPIEYFKPYLRPMSSMTDDEREEYRKLGGVMSYNPKHDTWAMCAFAPEAYDWLNKKQFDYRGLIPKGLALETPIEPKFKVGDWVVDKHYLKTYQVFSIDNSEHNYIVYSCKPLFNTNSDWPCFHEDMIRLWTIQDANDGDMLEFGDHGRLVVGIASYVNKTTGKVDVNCLLENNNFKVGIYYNLDTIKPHPATKEQRDLLFQKMKDAGYEWDDEMKELKKIEPKFKVGDCVVYNRNDSSREILYVYDIRDGRYYFNDNIHLSWSVKECDEKCHLWTIQDAKNGDVLAEHEIIVLFEKIEDQNIRCYCTYHYLGFNPAFYVDTLQNKNPYRPATKEQCDLLFQQMKDAGYEWDDEKKELKKIEQNSKPINPKFKVGDIISDGISEVEIVSIDKNKYNVTNGEIENDAHICNWVVYFKDQEKWKLAEYNCSEENKKHPQSKQEWSEDDEEKLRDVIRLVEQGAPVRPISDHYTDWLKSLKDRFQLQPKPEWSEADEKMWLQIINEMEAIKANSSTIFEKNIAQDKIDWLKSNKDRFQLQPKQEWSEGIKSRLDKISDFLQYKGREDDAEFIKSLESNYWKPTEVKNETKNKCPNYSEGYGCSTSPLKQCDTCPDYRLYNHWKPSEEQLIDLYYAAKQLSETRPNLQILYNDIKQL